MVVSQTFPRWSGDLHTSGESAARLSRRGRGGGWFPLLQKDPGFLPPCPTRTFGPPRLFPFEAVYDRLLPHAYPVVRGFLRRQIRRWKPDVILGPFPCWILLYRAYQVARELKAALLPLTCMTSGRRTTLRGLGGEPLAEPLEREILTNSRRVLCMTETQRVYYQKKYGVSPQILAILFQPGICFRTHDDVPETHASEDGCLCRFMLAGHEHGCPSSVGPGRRFYCLTTLTFCFARVRHGKSRIPGGQSRRFQIPETGLR